MPATPDTLEITKIQANMEFDRLTSQHKDVVNILGKPQKIPSYEFLFAGVNLEEALKNFPRILIPNQYLYGTQLPQEYEAKKRKQAVYKLQSEGINYLLRHPVIVCAIPDPVELTLAIFDGHHRARYSPKYGVFLIPSVVSTPEGLTQVLHDAGKTTLSPQAFTTYMRQRVDETLRAFDIRMPEYKRPKMHGIKTIDQLGDVFKQF